MHSVFFLTRSLPTWPQDPVLFRGTLRSNLDPWGTHPDATLWDVLAAVKLKEPIEAAGGLDHRMQEAGDNLSVGGWVGGTPTHSIWCVRMGREAKDCGRY